MSDEHRSFSAYQTRVLSFVYDRTPKIPCVKVDHLTEAQKKAYILADNRLAELSEWDEEMLKVEIEQLNDLEFDVDLLGFDLTEYFTEDINEEDLSEEDEYNEPLPEEPTSKLGDIYQLGSHRLMCGDSTDVDNVHALMGGVLADMLITDPPYNVDYHGGTSERLTIKNDKQGDTQFRAFLADAFNCADKVMKPGAVFYIWHADSEGFNFRAACRECGWTVRQCLIWKKSSLVLNDKMLVHNPDILIINPIVLGFTNNSFIKNISQNYPKTLLVALVSTYVDRNVLRYFKETIELSDTKQKVITKLINLINNNEDTSAQSENIELSNREIDVLICIAKGMTNKDISDRLNISVHTVITHRKNIIRKTGIKSVSGLTVYALLNNWVEESEIYE